jgi:zinc transporter ZupT
MHLIAPFLSVIVGYLIALFFRPKEKKNIKLLLAFSGSFLLSLTVLHLLPELYDTHEHDAHEHENVHIGVFIMIGILFQIILEFFSKGAEHGHVHGHDKMHQIPWLLFVSLCIHALLEGFPVSHQHSLSWGIAIHHLPIAVILTTFFANGNLNKIAIMLFMIGFALMTPFGTILAENIPVLVHYRTELTAVVVGILFHISSTIIFESNEGHKFNIFKLTVIILGTLFAYFI